MHVADLLHGAGQQYVTDHRRDHDYKNSAPRVGLSHSSDRSERFVIPSGFSRGEPAVACSGTVTVSTFAVAGRSARGAKSRADCESCGADVSAGPPATNPTPPEISAMPSQRSGLTCSCNTNLATSASST